jgi:hypothetical protein
MLLFTPALRRSAASFAQRLWTSTATLKVRRGKAGSTADPPERAHVFRDCVDSRLFVGAPTATLKVRGVHT